MRNPSREVLFIRQEFDLCKELPPGGAKYILLCLLEGAEPCRQLQGPNLNTLCP
jgi:hypothetical protein